MEVPTRFVLTAKGLFGERTAEADIAVAPPKHTFGGVAVCEEGNLRSEFVLEKQVSGEIAISVVTNVLGRPIVAEKGGRSAELAVGGRSSELSGERVAGVWVLTSPLRGGETCEQALRSVRQRLRVEIALRCEE